MATQTVADMDVGLNPIVNEAQLDKALASFARKLRTVQRGAHANLQVQAESLVKTAMRVSRFNTEAQAAAYIRDATGGSYSPQQRAILNAGASRARTARENMTAAESSAARNIIAEKRMRIDRRADRRSMETQSTEFQEINKEYEAAKENKATQREWKTMQRRTASLEEKNNKLLDRIEKSGRRLPNGFRQLSKDITGLKDNVHNVNPNDVKAAPTNWGNLAKLLGIGALGNFIRKSLIEGINQADKVLKQNQMYGGNRSVGLADKNRQLYGMSEEASYAPQNLAADFHQRMMWGETSEREIVGLSLMGRYGQMVMSGEAEKNPWEADRQLRRWMKSQPLDVVRQRLRQTGLPEELIFARSPSNTEETDERMKRLYQTQADDELEQGRRQERLRGGKLPVKRAWNQFWAQGVTDFIDPFNVASGRGMARVAAAPEYNRPNQTITINQTISSTDPRAAGEESARKTTDALRDIQDKEAMKRTNVIMSQVGTAR